MKERGKGRIYVRALVVMVVVAGLMIGAGLTGAQGGAPTVVSYQGRVTVDGTPYTGTGYFKLAVVDTATGNGTTNYWANDGTASGQPGTAVSLAVVDGLFTVLLGDTGLANMAALPATVFEGPERYLRVWFSADGGAFSPLEPNQRIAAVPYALQAEESKDAAAAAYAAEAGNADTLDGQHATAFQQHYAGVVVVAKSGGDYDTISAALNSIDDASETNRYLVKVMPGVYTETVTMMPFVDIEGAGELTTKITYSGSLSDNTGTVVGANDAELRFLTVENSGGENCAIAIYNSSASPRLTHLTATASGAAYGYGVYNSSSSPAMTDVTAIASGAASTNGVFNINSSSPAMANVTAIASGGTDINTGVYNSYSSPAMTNVTATGAGGMQSQGVSNFHSSPAMTNVIATASGGTENSAVFNGPSSLPRMENVTATASGGAYNYGVRNSNSSPAMTNVTAAASAGTTANYGVYSSASAPTMTGVTATASGGTDSYGLYNLSSSATIQNSVIGASEGTNNYGIYNEAQYGSFTVQVNNSQLKGGTNTIRNDSEFTVQIGTSKLEGGAVSAGGTVTCAGVYDEAYAFYANTCP